MQATGPEALPGLQSLYATSGSESDGALRIGTYCFLGKWLTRSPQDPRPASPGSTSEVETNHPHVEFSNDATAAPAPRGATLSLARPFPARPPIIRAAGSGGSTHAPLAP